MTGAISNSNDDQEIPGRTLGVLRSWVDHNVTVSVNAREVKFLSPYSIHCQLS